MPVAQLYKTWTDADSLHRWLPDAAKMTVRKANLNKSLRITWIDGQSSVEVYFWIKGPAKSQVAVQHGKLKSAEDMALWKDYWSGTLLTLQALLEGTTVPTAGKSVARPARRYQKSNAAEKAATDKTGSAKKPVPAKKRRTS